ncbi:MAG: ATP-binding protein [Melioribacteraceae bacterium]
MKMQKELKQLLNIRILVITLVVSFVLILCGYIFYTFLANSEKTTKENEIETITNLKVQQLIQWQNERKADAIVLSKSIPLKRNITDWNNNKIKNNVSSEIKYILLGRQTNYGYKAIFLSNAKGELLISTDEEQKKIEKETITKIIDAVKNRQMVINDFFYSEIDHQTYYEIIIPLIDTKSKLLAIVVLRIDPTKYIYPLLKSSTSTSKSTETFLIKKDKNKIQFLNELKHKSNSILKFESDFSGKYPSIIVKSGNKGIIYSKDYRDVEVVSYISPIVGTNWIMISKIDMEEVFSELKYWGIGSAVFIFLLILIVVVGLNWVYQYRQSNIYRVLWESQEKNEIILKSIGDAVITTDNNGYIQFLNPIAEELTGWKLDESKGKQLSKVFNIINETTREKVDNPVDKVLRKGCVVELSNHSILISRNGKEIHITNNGAPIRNEIGDIYGVVLVFKDQSKQWYANEEISRLNRLYALLSSTNHTIVRNRDKIKLFNEICLTSIKKGGFQLVWVGIFNNTTNRIEVTANSYSNLNQITNIEESILSSERCLFLSDQVLKTSNHFIVSDLSNEPNISGLKMDKLLEGSNSAASFPIKLNNEIIGTFNLFSKEVDFFKEKEISLLQEMAMDVSFAIEFINSEQIRKINEIKIKKNNEELKEYFDNDISADYIADVQGNIINCNSTFLNLFGFENKSQINEYKAEQLFANPLDRKKLIEELRKNKRIENYSVDFINRNNQVINSILNASGVFDEQGDLKQIRTYIVDLTKLIQIEKELIFAKEKAEESEKLKSEFLSLMSHEIRSPMNAVLNFSEILMEELNGLLSPVQLEYFDGINSSGRRLVRTVELIINASEIQVSTYDPIFAKFDLINNVLEKIIIEYASMIKKKGLEIEFHKNVNEAIIYADEYSVSQTFMNLLDNAVKYTEKGKIEIILEVDSIGNFLVIISDTGIGISKEFIETKLFQPFSQEEEGYSRRYEGNGLGLMLVKKYCELNKAEISIDSTKGVGSKFKILFEKMNIS